MSYKAITREDTVWAGDYVGCGVGLGADAQPKPVLGVKIPVPPGGGGTTGVLPRQSINRTVQVPAGWRKIDSYKGWSIMATPDPRYTCPPGAMCKITPDIYRAVRAGGGASPVGTKSATYRWVDVQASRPEASEPVTVRPEPTAPEPAVIQQLPPQVPQAAVAPPPQQVVKAATDQAPDQPTKKGKGLLTAAGIAAAAYMLLG